MKFQLRTGLRQSVSHGFPFKSTKYDSNKDLDWKSMQSPFSSKHGSKSVNLCFTCIYPGLMTSVTMLNILGSDSILLIIMAALNS